MTVLRPAWPPATPPTAVADARLRHPGLGRAGRAGRPRRRSPRRRAGTRSIPPALQEFSKYNGNWVAAPVNVHSTNWVWVNKAVLDKVGVKPSRRPGTSFIALLDKAKEAGVIPLAHGGQPWQDATIFDSVVLSDRRARLLQEGDDRPRPGGARLRHHEEGLRPHGASSRGYVDPNFSGRDWNLATAMVIKGEAGMQIMGDWAKGEFVNAGKKPGTGLPVLPLPRHAGQRDLQLRPVRHVQGERRTGRTAQIKLAAGDHGPGVPGGLQRREGLGPGAHRRARRQLRRLRQEGASPTSRTPPRRAR